MTDKSNNLELEWKRFPWIDRYLELQSSGRRDELRLHYVSRRDGSVHVEAFPFRLADGAWHKVALSVSGSQIELLVDCHLLYRRLLRPGPPDTNFTLPQLQLWVGQRNARHFLFKVRPPLPLNPTSLSLSHTLLCADALFLMPSTNFSIARSLIINYFIDYSCVFSILKIQIIVVSSHQLSLLFSIYLMIIMIMSRTLRCTRCQLTLSNVISNFARVWNFNQLRQVRTIVAPQGALQDVKLVAGPHGYLSQCPLLDSFCPTCGQFSILQNTVEQLMRNLNELTRRVSMNVHGRTSVAFSRWGSPRTIAVIRSFTSFLLVSRCRGQDKQSGGVRVPKVMQGKRHRSRGWCDLGEGLPTVFLHSRRDRMQADTVRTRQLQEPCHSSGAMLSHLLKYANCSVIN